MKKLVVLRGNSGSGKTTAAQALQRKFGPHTMRISQDMVRREILMVKDGPGNPAVDLLAAMLEYGWEHSEITILEGILDAQVYDPVFQKACQLYGHQVFAYYYDIPFEETLLRHGTKPNHADFGEAEMRRWWKEKDFVPALHETVFTQELTLEQAVEKVYHEVNGS